MSFQSTCLNTITTYVSLRMSHRNGSITLKKTIVGMHPLHRPVKISIFYQTVTFLMQTLPQLFLSTGILSSTIKPICAKTAFSNSLNHPVVPSKSYQLLEQKPSLLRIKQASYSYNLFIKTLVCRCLFCRIIIRSIEYLTITIFNRIHISSVDAPKEALIENCRGSIP